MERYDVIIIGAGPAGSACAWHLRRNGIDVAVIDKSNFPRNKVCAGWITPAVIDSLAFDIDEYAAQYIFQPFDSFTTGIIGAKSITSHYDKPISYGIRRCEFDHYLLQRSGAVTVLNEKITAIKKQPHDWLINEKYTAPMLIGAGGHFCPVARLLGAKLGHNEAIVSAQEIEFEMDSQQLKQCRVNAQTPQLYFCEDLKGYGWVVRKQNYLNIGLGRQENRKLSEHISQFMQWLKSNELIPASVCDKMQGHAYLLYGENNRPLIDENVVIIGDAAGLAYAQSGEGIRPAIESGLIAARTVLEANGDYNQNNLSAYVRRLEDRLGKRTNKIAKKDNNALLQYALPTLSKIALNNRWFSKHIVIDRWFLHRHQAALVI